MSNWGQKLKKRLLKQPHMHSHTVHFLPPHLNPHQHLFTLTLSICMCTHKQSVLCRCFTKSRLMNYASASTIYGKGAAQSVCGCYTAATLLHCSTDTNQTRLFDSLDSSRQKGFTLAFHKPDKGIIFRTPSLSAGVGGMRGSVSHHAHKEQKLLVYLFCHV